MTFMPWLLALFILVGGGQPTETPTAIVKRYWAQYADWVTHRDVESLSNLYGPDARVMEAGNDNLPLSADAWERFREHANDASRVAHFIFPEEN